MAIKHATVPASDLKVGDNIHVGRHIVRVTEAPKAHGNLVSIVYTYHDYVFANFLTKMIANKRKLIKPDTTFVKLV